MLPEDILYQSISDLLYKELILPLFFHRFGVLLVLQDLPQGYHLLLFEQQKGGTGASEKVYKGSWGDVAEQLQPGDDSEKNHASQ